MLYVIVGDDKLFLIIFDCESLIKYGIIVFKIVDN